MKSIINHILLDSVVFCCFAIRLLMTALTRGQRPLSQPYSFVFNLGQSCGQ